MEFTSSVSADLIKWKFQVEQQGFITRYGIADIFHYKQVVLQFGALPKTYPVKRIDKRVYETALRLSKVLE